MKMTRNDITEKLNERYQELRYLGGADIKGFGVDKLLHSTRLNDDASTFAHRWYSAGVEAAYLAVKNRPDVPEDVKQGLAAGAGLPVNIDNMNGPSNLLLERGKI